jgi:hypothetical protein
VYALAGLGEKAREILSDLLTGESKRYVSPAKVGLTCYALGEKENGYKWTQVAYEQRDPGLPFFCKWSASYPSWKDERFIKLL